MEIVETRTLTESRDAGVLKNPIGSCMSASLSRKRCRNLRQPDPHRRPPKIESLDAGNRPSTVDDLNPTCPRGMSF